MSPPNEAPTEETSIERPVVAAIELGDWEGLGNDKVRLELSPRRTVLVGRNGAGKSLLLAGIFRASQEAWLAPRSRAETPRYFRCDIRRPLQSFSYEFQKYENDEDEDETETTASSETSVSVPPRVQIQKWTERCWLSEAGTDLWRVANGMLTVAEEEPVQISPGIGMLATMDSRSTRLPEAALVWSMLIGFALIPAGVPRNDPAHRRDVYVRSSRNPSQRRWMRSAGGGRIESLAYTLAFFADTRRELFDEFAALARQLRLADTVDVRIYEDPAPRGEERRDFASVMFDGVNIGLLSDGTLRISELLVDLIRRVGSVVLVEEPETGVHPGLLSRLLQVVDSYALDRQIVISTHSPIVVDWCQWDELRLVERRDTRTTVRGLTKTESTQIKNYLDDEGLLSDFIYSQSEE